MNIESKNLERLCVVCGKRYGAHYGENCREPNSGLFFDPVDEETEGQKDDSEKIRMDLLPFESLEAVAKVLTFGAKKYAANNWQKVDNAESRYVGALLRHLSKYLQGEEKDGESGLSHLSHVATNALFLVYFEEKKKDGRHS